MRLNFVLLSKTLQHMACYPFGKLLLPKKHGADSVFAQESRLVLTVSAHDDFDGWVERACDVCHLTHSQGIRRRDDQHRGVRDMRLD